MPAYHSSSQRLTPCFRYHEESAIQHCGMALRVVSERRLLGLFYDFSVVNDIDGSTALAMNAVDALSGEVESLHRPLLKEG